MPTANVNILAVLVAAVLTFVLGAVWYSPVLFAKQWMAAQGYTAEKLEEMKRKGVTRAYAVSVLCYLVTAYVMALLASYTNSTTLAQGLWLGLLSWLWFAATVGLTANMFSEKPIADFPRVHDVFCCLGTTMKQAGSRAAFRTVDYTYVVELARVAVRHRASQFLVVTALGADPRSRIFYGRVKGEAEEALRRLQFEGIQIFRPSWLVGARAKGRPIERMAGLLSPLVAWAFVGPAARALPS